MKLAVHDGKSCATLKTAVQFVFHFVISVKRDGNGKRKYIR